MASSTPNQINVQGEKTFSIDSTIDPVGWKCLRCGGLLVRHICMDLYNTGSELEIPARRCVQCGEVVDSVILRNRRIQYESSIAHQAHTARFSKKMPAAEQSKVI